MLLAFHKPYDVLSQFTREMPSHRTLSDHSFPPHVYPVGRLDRDSEGLLLLSDEPAWNDRLLHPRHKHPRSYHAQVEGAITPQALATLKKGGIDLKDHRTLPCGAHIVEHCPHPDRSPPIRYRASIPTTWIELTLVEGKNRQVRRMTAAVGFPTLRLIRVSIGRLRLEDLALQPGQWRELSAEERARVASA